MTRDDEVLLSILLDNLVGLFLSRFRSRRVGGTTCYLPVYEPVVHEVLGLADGVISRAPIRNVGAEILILFTTRRRYLFLWFCRKCIAEIVQIPTHLVLFC